MGRKTDLQMMFDVVQYVLNPYVPPIEVTDDSIEFKVNGKIFVISIKEKEEKSNEK